MGPKIRTYAVSFNNQILFVNICTSIYIFSIFSSYLDERNEEFIEQPKFPSSLDSYFCIFRISYERNVSASSLVACV